MGIVNLKFRNTEISINCDDEARIKLLSERFNKRVEEVSNDFQNTSDLKLFIITSLMIEDQLDVLMKKAENDLDLNMSGVLEVKKTFNSTMIQIAEYIEDLAIRIEKS